jgi:pimeloyl-ACP methyl ester carboxylesterase
VTPAQRSAWIQGYSYIAQLCGARNGELLEHVSTTETARDLDLLRRAVGDPQLYYQGESYGTFLGATYANLFPDRVHTMVLLGNINAPAWVTADEDDPRPNTFLGTQLRQNSDKGGAATLNAFLALCGHASTNQCAFSPGSPAATGQKWKALLQNVLAQPVTLDGVTWDYDAVVTSVAQTLTLVAGWPLIGDSLQQIWNGNNSSGPTSSAPDATDEPVTVPSQGSAVRCAESPNPSHPQAYIALADLAYDRSGDIGPWYNWFDEKCAGWPAVAVDRYTGPWDKPTAHPLLLVNNTYDPATPYSNAAFMANTFANARLLTVTGYGHVLGGQTSTCANNYISSYFINGSLPPLGAMCRPDQAPFTTSSNP